MALQDEMSAVPKALSYLIRIRDWRAPIQSSADELHGDARPDGRPVGFVGSCMRPRVADVGLGEVHRISEQGLLGFSQDPVQPLGRRARRTVHGEGHRQHAP
jgi:hypothetical protein